MSRMRHDDDQSIQKETLNGYRVFSKVMTMTKRKPQYLGCPSKEVAYPEVGRTPHRRIGYLERLLLVRTMMQASELRWVPWKKMSLGKVRHIFKKFLCVFAFLGGRTKGRTKGKRVLGVQFSESFASPPFILISETISLSCSRSRRSQYSHFSLRLLIN